MLTLWAFLKSAWHFISSEIKQSAVAFARNVALQYEGKFKKIDFLELAERKVNVIVTESMADYSRPLLTQLEVLVSDFPLHLMSLMVIDSCFLY